MENTRAVSIPVWIDQLQQDTRYGIRTLRRTSAFSTVVILTLAFGIGLNTAVFSIFNAVLLRPLAYPDAERLISLSGARGGAAVGDPKLLAFALFGAVNWIQRWYNPDGPARSQQIADLFGDLFTAGLRPHSATR